MTERPRWRIVAYVLPLIVATAAGVLVSQIATKKATSQFTRSEVNELRSELAQLREEQQQTARGLGLALQSHLGPAATASSCPASDGLANNQQQTAPDFQDALVPDRQKRKELMESTNRKMKEAFDNERPDPRWAPDARKEVEAAFSVPELASLRHTANCATTLCQVQFSFDPGDTEKIKQGMMAMHLPWGAKDYVSVDAQGRGVYYCARDGYDLPTMEP